MQPGGRPADLRVLELLRDESLLAFYDDEVDMIADPGWQTRGVASGIGGSMPWGILCTLRDGLVVRNEWFLEAKRARTALAA